MTYTISKFYNEILKNFISAAVLYMPKFVIDLIEEDQNFEKSLDLQQYSNRLFAFDVDGNPYFPENDGLRIVSGKKVLLDENILILLQYKDHYLSFTFDFILKKYGEYLFVLLRFSQWLLENINQHLKASSSEYHKAFQLQYDFLKKHGVEVNELFEFNMDLSVFEGSSHLNSKGEFNKARSVKEFRGLYAHCRIESDPVKARKNKLAFLKEFTNEYADGLILKQVFNVIVLIIMKDNMKRSKVTKDDVSLNFRLPKELKAIILKSVNDTNTTLSQYLREVLERVHDGSYCEEQVEHSKRSKLLLSADFFKLIFWINTKRLDNKNLESDEQRNNFVKTIKVADEYLPDSINT
ncbi:hypothetical protein [Winogradskyella sp. PG-2]|uniref:hypothetical protein n=1 Tax=Winogradskyella sp. PG-2 TaxID=754409 RepID=UPI00045884FC|nr:hypothetical protein [Winogradskyella sp. PG-2]BAO76352.1 hypothetical protein WPG_2122 [Winogradskyella sp. PG-2]